MSKVKIQGNASGSGTLTIAAPNTNTDRTLTLPDGAGEILLSDGDGSQLTGISTGTNNEGSFSTRLPSTQSISNTTWTKLNFTTGSFGFDTDGIFNNTTNAFTAPATGVYFIGSGVRISTMTGLNDAVYLRTYVNGNQPTGAVGGEPLETLHFAWAASNNSLTAQTHGLMKLNSGDVVDMRVYTTAGARSIYVNGSFFVGFRVS